MNNHRSPVATHARAWGPRAVHLLAKVAALLAISTSAAAADTWPSFRRDGSGTVEAKNVPLHWSPEQGIAWRSEIAGYGQSAPVVWNNTVYVTSSDGPFQERCFVHAFDLRSGQRRWVAEIAATTKVENYFRNSRAAPTCVVDANRVVSFFASGDVTAISHQGETLWTVPLFQKFGEVDNERGTASSPAQNDDLVFLVVDHGGPSYIVAIRKRDGQIAWKTDRGTRVPSWSSPLVVQHKDREMVVISSSDTVDAYDTGSGQPLWQVEHLQGNHIPSATIAGDRLFVGSTEMYGGTADAAEAAGSNCRIDQQTGKQVFAKRIGNPCWASAIGVETETGELLVYFVLKNGFTIILRPGESYDQVARNQLWDREQMVAAAEAAEQLRDKNAVPPDQAQPKQGPEKIFAGMPETALHQMFSYGDPTAYAAVIVDDRLLVRTGQHLYCIGTADAPAEDQ